VSYLTTSCQPYGLYNAECRGDCGLLLRIFGARSIVDGSGPRQSSITVASRWSDFRIWDLLNIKRSYQPPCCFLKSAPPAETVIRHAGHRWGGCFLESPLLYWTSDQVWAPHVEQLSARQSTVLFLLIHAQNTEMQINYFREFDARLCLLFSLGYRQFSGLLEIGSEDFKDFPVSYLFNNA